jgi:hypothetical protein
MLVVELSAQTYQTVLLVAKPDCGRRKCVFVCRREEVVEEE